MLDMVKEHLIILTVYRMLLIFQRVGNQVESTVRTWKWKDIVQPENIYVQT